ncbi:SAM-dependent methyltransferase [Kitasatospora paracochleata]|uniref:O-methyltransferase involved in polyketide biosynthesis n=1 Tax=Kitasatospora paracochleata TaxID=58354 RepID=A0ABT1IT41_9ACTN|nr:SAM-dependent methyltransferase [Kitasatospora paracochleata]MCP2308303.1 O-methyltransferase involved in polyketide biosynthesis [Kitasatospora paracochleata]
MTTQFEAPSLARAVDYLLGGEAHGPADRQAADRARAAWPTGDLRTELATGRAVLGRMVAHLLGELGIRQLLDIGAGLPTAGNTHQVAARVAPGTRVVYVDRDPEVVEYSRRLLKQQPKSPTVYVRGELDDPDRILRDAAATLDLSQPIGLVLFGVLDQVHSAEDPACMVKSLLDAVPSHSCVAFGHLAAHVRQQEMDLAYECLLPDWRDQVVRRNRAEAAALLDGDLELLPPGVVGLPDWRPVAETGPAGPPTMWCAVARKP